VKSSLLCFENHSADLGQREIARIKDEDPEGIQGNRKRKLDGDDVPESVRAYKTSRSSDGIVMVDLTDD
jgi:hypothetical protein